METKKIPISKIKKNPKNPRLIKDAKFDKLVKSIQEFPQMLEIRPIVVNTDMVILGGNMRFEAAKKAGLKEVSIIIADQLTADQQAEFIIKDNVGFGDWDWDALANEWDEELLDEWGLDIPNWNTENEKYNLDSVSLTDYSDKNKEINVDELDSNMTIKLNYVESEYWAVKEALLKIAETPEKAVYKLLGL